VPTVTWHLAELTRYLPQNVTGELRINDGAPDALRLSNRELRVGSRVELRLKRPGYKDLVQEFAAAAGSVAPAFSRELFRFEPTEELTTLYNGALDALTSGRPHEALKQFDAVSDLDPAFRDLPRLRRSAREQCEKLDREKTADWTAARRLYDERRWGAARAAFAAYNQ
jgi:hypothetical protein